MSDRKMRTDPMRPAGGGGTKDGESSISPAAETPPFKAGEEPREFHQQQTFRRTNIRTRRHDGSRSSGGDGRTPCRSGSFGRTGSRLGRYGTPDTSRRG